MKMRVAASVAVTVLLSVALTGCQFLTPQQTTASYTPSDGVNGDVGPIQIRNVLVLAGEDDTASMIGVLANSGDTAQSVELQWTAASGTATERVAVPAGGLVSLSTAPSTIDASVPGESSAVLLDGVDATPGGLFNVTFSTTDAQQSLQLPVLTGSFSEYATLVPTPTPTPTPTRTRKATDEPTDAATPKPTETLAG